MIEFLLGLALGLIVLCIYAAIVSGSKYDLELEIARLKKELRILTGELKMVDETVIGGKDEKL